MSFAAIGQLGHFAEESALCLNEWDVLLSKRCDTHGRLQTELHGVIVTMKSSSDLGFSHTPVVVG
eukprot:CAMPEP_0174321322 /NCGR_PEP_ID=MMETSP0810-20121108/10204_1 /TAXON_ID=73025 ORGANISM="Eutreptiella gymnastica-like, Strain CCMP1594" /NCGR_SAMPLE_ID=MMETSP0810 /ASSEMBLY_ACC=CAM_ASM_000659 /LENGTH=64 /DNA_ID=CAMNT_0015432659 /DNA_START=427 /DNA_END=621 /DNA_ORIENTATION=-